MIVIFNPAPTPVYFGDSKVCSAHDWTLAEHEDVQDLSDQGKVVILSPDVNRGVLNPKLQELYAVAYPETKSKNKRTSKQATSATTSEPDLIDTVTESSPQLNKTDESGE